MQEIKNLAEKSDFLTYLNTTFTQWFSKKQSTGETSVFGTEFVTIKQGIDALKGSKHKARMMGVPISSLSYIDGENMSVVHNTSKQESV